MGTDIDQLADAAAVRAILAGNTARYRELVDRYQKRVYATVLRIVGRPAEAEDLTQQTFIEGYNALRRYDSDRRFLSWLLRIAVNNCKDFLKSHKRREVSLAFEATGSRAMYAGEVDGPERAARRHEQARRLEGALATLDDKYRIPVVLRDVEGLSYSEIQQIVDLPLSTLKIRVVRARQQLQLRLEDLRDG